MSKISAIQINKAYQDKLDETLGFRAINLNSTDIWSKNAKNCTQFILKCPANMGISIYIEEEKNDLYLLNKVLLLLRKLKPGIHINLVTDYLIHDHYKIYLADKLVNSVNLFDVKEIEELKPAIDKKILLIAPLAWSPKFPQLGLAYISASLKQEGYHVDVLDSNVDFFQGADLSESDKNKFRNMPAWIDKDIYLNSTKKHADIYINKILDYIEDKGFDIVGLSIHYSSELFSHDLLQAIKLKHPHIKTMVGGPSTHEPFVDKAMKNNYLDLAIKGEGEFIVKEAAKYLLGHDANISGCIINDNGQSQVQESKKLANMKELIEPDFAGFDVYDYESYRLPTSLSRGCVAKCTFCFETLYWKKFRIKSPVDAVHEIMSLADKYKIRNFSINDSLMNGSHKLLEQFCDKVIEKDFPIQFYGYCRVDKKLTFNILDKMKKAGCYSISYGIESGSKKILDDMAKGVDKKYILPTLKATSKAEIEVVCCFIVGYPGENLWDYLQTLILIFRGRKYITELNLSIFQPSHETKMMLDPKKYNLRISEDGEWDSTEFWNTQKVLRLKHNIIHTMWGYIKKRSTSPEKWSYKYNMG